MAEEKEENQVNRRTFLDYLIGGSFAVLGLAVTGTMIAYILPSRKKAGGSMSRTEVAAVEKLPEGKATKIIHQGKPVIVGNTRQGYFALSATCTHLGCLVNWDETKQQLFCPCHAAFFDTRGNVLAGPAPSPLPSYDVLVSGGKIYVGNG